MFCRAGSTLKPLPGFACPMRHLSVPLDTPFPPFGNTTASSGETSKQPCLPNQLPNRSASVSCRLHRRFASCTTSLLRRTSLAFMLATVHLLRDGPTSNPVRKAGFAVEGLRCRAVCIVGAAPVVHFAAPCLLRVRPAALPIREAQGAVEGIRRGSDRRRRGGPQCGWKRHGWRSRRRSIDGPHRDSVRASDMVHLATPASLWLHPLWLRSQAAIEGVPRRWHRSGRGQWSWRQGRWLLRGRRRIPHQRGSWQHFHTAPTTHSLATVLGLRWTP